MSRDRGSSDPPKAHRELPRTRRMPLIIGASLFLVLCTICVLWWRTGAREPRAAARTGPKPPWTDSPTLESPVTSSPTPHDVLSGLCAVIRGRVVDSNTAPVPSCRLALTVADGRAASRDNTPVVTDAMGAFTIPVAEVDLLYSLEASAPGYVTARREGVSAGQTVVIHLRPGVALRFHVCDSVTQAPLPGALVVVAQPPASAGTSSLSVSMRTDPRGDCECEVAAVVSTTVVASDISHVPALLTLVSPPSGIATRSVSLHGGRLVRGSVVDRVTRAPISGAIVGFIATAYPTVSTDAAGRYEYSCVPRGDGDATQIDGHAVRLGDLNTLVARAEGYAPGVVDIGAGSADAALDFALDPLESIRGRVVSGAGDGVGACQVTVSVLGTESAEAAAITGVTDSNGCFDVVGAVRGKRHVLVFSATGYGREWRDVTIDISHRGSIDIGEISLRASVCLRMRVVDDGGVNVADAAIRLVIASAVPAEAALMSEWTAVSDDNGMVAIGGLPEGHYVVEGELPDGAITRCRMTLSRATAEVRLVLGRGARGERIAGAPIGRPRVMGCVTKVRSMTVTVSVGSESGAARGMIFAVVRGGTIIGRLVVRRAGERESTTSVCVNKDGTLPEVKSGDDVVEE